MPIVDLEASTRVGWSPVDVAAAYLRGGARCLQIRGKTASGAAYLDLAQRIVALARAGEAVVVVNDRAEIAALAHADGVHVGQTDLAPALIRRIVGDRSIVGLSTHTTAQLAVAVAEPVTYVAIGPVFSTATKSTGYEAIGLAVVRAAAAIAGPAGLPLVAIGGITLQTARSVIDAGASAVAVIADLLSTGDPEGQTRDFLERLV